MSLKTLQKNVVVSGTPEQLAGSVEVESGLPVVVKAKKANTGSISVGDSSSDAQKASTVNFTLANNEAVEVRVENLNEIWIDATVNGEGVEVLFEPRT